MGKHTINHEPELWSISDQPSSLSSLFSNIPCCLLRVRVTIEGIVLDLHSQFTFLHASVRRTIFFFLFLSLLFHGLFKGCDVI